MSTRSSIAVILSNGGAVLDLAALSDVPNARVVSAEIAAGRQAACVAATLEHDCAPSELLAGLQAWAASRGWSVTVAPLPGPR